MIIEVVDNPRRKKRRRYTAKQRSYGFGGKRRRTSRRSPRPSTRRRRRNPAIASLGNPPRRRRSYRRRPRYTVTGVSRRRRSNPIRGPLGLDLSAAMYIGIGMFGTEVLPRFVKKAWPAVPTTGIMGYLVQAGSAIVVGFGIGRITNRRNGQLAAAGGIALILLNLFRQYAAPWLSLGGLGNDYAALTYGDISDVGGYVTTDQMGGYVKTNAMSGYRANPVGAYGM